MQDLKLLQQACASLGLKTSQAQEQQLQTFLELLAKWNTVYNLTAITAAHDIMVKHVFDSLAVLAHLPTGGRIIDVGSGAGFPGVPLAIYAPELQFELLDSNGKKTRFLQHVVAQLKLNNVKVQCARVEQWQPSEQFDVVLARAFAAPAEIVRVTKHLLRNNGQWLLMSAKLREDEIEALAKSALQVQVIPLTVPFLDAERHLIKIQCQQ